MILAWLQKIAGLLGGLLTFGATFQAQALLQKSVIFLAVVGGLIAAFLTAMGVIRSLGQQAIGYISSELAGNSWSNAAMEWIGCVTPTTFPQALSVVFAVFVTVGMFRVLKWLGKLTLSST